MKNIFYVIILLISLTNCHKNRYYVYSPDKKQCITIITEMNKRYIINGKHYFSIPEKDYVLYSLDSINKEIGDEIVGHWNKSNIEWEIATDNAIIIENKLNKNKFEFTKNFPKDQNGNPTIIDYTDGNSFDIGFEYGKIINCRGAIVE